MSHAFRKTIVTGLLILGGIVAVFMVWGLVLAVIALWPGNAAPQVRCAWVPRGKFSDNELHRLDGASSAKPATYRACVVRSYEGLHFVQGLPSDDVVVELPGVTAQQVAARTGWKPAANMCPLGEQDIQRTFGKEQTAQWTALTWNGEPAVCNTAAPAQLPDVVLAQGDTAYELFTDTFDQLSSYLH
jgi:hypothetical protein